MLNLDKSGYIEQSGCILAKWFYSSISGCIRAKVVVFGQKWLYSGRVVVFGKVVVLGQKWLYSRNVVVFGQNLFYLDKVVLQLSKVVVCIRAKVGVFGQSGCNREAVVVLGQKWLYS